MFLDCSPIINSNGCFTKFYKCYKRTPISYNRELGNNARIIPSSFATFTECTKALVHI